MLTTIDASTPKTLELETQISNLRFASNLLQLHNRMLQTMLQEVWDDSETSEYTRQMIAKVWIPDI